MDLTGLRPNQRQILEYRSGWMGISAVPGSGKTWTLSHLAAKLVLEMPLEDDQEILVVTMVNSAVDNFSQRVNSFMNRQGLFPNLNYRVRTLHGLAHDIVRQRPGSLGLSDRFLIIDEQEANAIRNQAAAAWLASHPDALGDYLDPVLDENRRDWVRRDKLPILVQDIALAFIRTAKDLQLTPERLRERLDRLPLPLPLAEMGCDLYHSYQQALNYRGGVDFDDLIRLALQALQQEPEYLDSLRHRWPFILEDEAQDSSRLQEAILSLLAGPHGNWVRVGDPNQAIYETFTTASPTHLINFIASPGVQPRTLPNSGRSTASIIDLANQLVLWTQEEHPVEAARDALQGPPFIQPAPPGDPQENPPDRPEMVRLVLQAYAPQEEIVRVVDSLARWLPNNPDATVAVLVPRNERGFELVDALRRKELPVFDGLLRSSQTTRSSAGVLANMLSYLSAPGSASRLGTVYKVWRRDSPQDEAGKARQERVLALLRKLPQVEDFLWPEPERDWLAESGLAVSEPEIFAELEAFRSLVRRWLGAALLPIDQVVLTLSQDLLSEPPELAISHKLAASLRRANQLNTAWRLPELTSELAQIAKNQRRFLGFDRDETGFVPAAHKGKVVVATIHKAKGLEWDRVYLMSVNNYDFPSALPGDTFISERWFLRDNLNLEAEAQAQLEAALSNDGYGWYREGPASASARLDYTRERLRLLYVGITRAKQELVITWNTGRRGDCRPAAPFAALSEYWQSKKEMAA